MSAYLYSVVLVIPGSLREDANQLARALGHDDSPAPGQTFGTAFSEDGEPPATHWATRTQSQQGFVDLLAEAAQGQFPAAPQAGGAWSDYGLDGQRIMAVVVALGVDLQTMADLDALGLSVGEHWRQAMAARGLVRMRNVEDA